MKSVSAYLLALFLIDGIGRQWVLGRFGYSSLQYFYFYYLTDAILALGAFLLVCTFFRRACAQQERMWQYVRLILPCVFFLVFGISGFSLTENYNHLFSSFMVEFEQNLYFTCLVLNEESGHGHTWARAPSCSVSSRRNRRRPGRVSRRSSSSDQW